MVTPPLFEPGDTCWRTEQAERVAILIDSSAYFTAALSAIRRAKRSIMLLGWGFDPRTRLRPDPSGEEHGPDEIGALLRRLSVERPDLDIRILIWKSALPISASQDFFPHRARSWFEGTRVRFELDASVPFGGCHHQKVLVIDDALAFCGGGDFGVDRWDSSAHLDHDLRRLMPSGLVHAPRHEVMMMVDGAAAAALGALARNRWSEAQGANLPVCPATDYDPWPPFVTPLLRGARVAIARTEPAWGGQPEVREIEALHLRAIEQARHTIYLENQYFTSTIVGCALARRLAEPDGPEVVLISSLHSPSYFDRWTMDRTRWRLVSRLQQADLYGRFRAFCPQTEEGRQIIVHSKVSIIDDRLLRVGSANLNHRSAGFDTECDLVVQAAEGDADAANSIHAVRSRLLGHYLGVGAPAVEAAVREKRSLIAAIDGFVQVPGARLRPLPRPNIGPLAAVIAAYHLGDPVGVTDSWKPLLRRRLLAPYEHALQAFAQAGPRSAQPEIDHQRQVVGGGSGQWSADRLHLKDLDAVADEDVIDGQHGKA
jgi:phosphatidylserine/phosphatidylglycerophosphate/cardiolipin synthase-like enzyme